MEEDVWRPEIKKLAEEHMEERQRAARSTLANPAILWRSRSPDDPVAIRLLNQSEMGISFICPFPLEAGEIFDYALEHNSVRRTGLHVAACELLSEDIYRIGAHF